MSERKPEPPAGARVPPRELLAATDRSLSARDAGLRRAPNKFGSAADGWDAYNDWLDRVRQPAPPSDLAADPDARRLIERLYAEDFERFGY